MLKLEDVRENPQVASLLQRVQENLKTMGKITHDEKHAHHVGNLSYHILKVLGYSQREAELAAIAGYLHDIGNAINRYDHGRTGALLAFHILMKMGMPPEEVATVIAAIGNHEERSGYTVSNVAAAVILADKSNVHRSRVHKGDPATFTTRDRVNYAATKSFLDVDPEKREIIMHLEIDTSICSVMEYFEIFLTKMLLCRRAANFLNCRFGLVINGTRFL
ncbi:MAG: Metal dependent phosphohydrolase [Thermoanaerobacterales bacterium 50_218]|nr:MAG: Metal dependent phosphohydrolase [Thermoanaerobacterales bacterium 50_218]HAA90738.1 phosphohydrolase [Peptococcaceae bacterium]